MYFTVLQVGQLREVSNKVHNAELKLFLEVEMGMVTFVLLKFKINLFLLNFTGQNSPAEHLHSCLGFMSNRTT